MIGLLPTSSHAETWREVWHLNWWAAIMTVQSVRSALHQDRLDKSKPYNKILFISYKELFDVLSSPQVMMILV